jgi:predicted acetyltransferase
VNLVLTSTIDVAWNELDAPFLSSRSRIQKGMQDKDVIAYYFQIDDEIIGFATIRQWNTDAYFIWNFMIMESYRSKGYGGQALRMLLNALFENGAKTITTTRVASNLAAQKLFSRHGFVDTDTVQNDHVHEINMKWSASATEHVQTEGSEATPSEPNRCPRCGENNHCAMTNHTDPMKCWCVGIAIPSELSNRLRERYPAQACLCQTCLNDELGRHQRVDESVHS